MPSRFMSAALISWTSRYDPSVMLSTHAPPWRSAQLARAWKKRRGNPNADARICLDETGEAFAGRKLAKTFREDLVRAGVDRAQLFERTAERQPIRVHDLRASFVTLALAIGKS